METNLSLGGGDTYWLSVNPPPQQATLSEFRRAQVCAQPLLSNANRSPSGGDACRKVSSPQQTTLPLARKAQVCTNPLLIDSNWSPSGGDVIPKALYPQQTTTPSKRKGAGVESTAAD